MNHYKILIRSIILFVVSAGIIVFTNISVMLFPSQENKIKADLEWGALTKEFIIIQEVTLKKEYLKGIDVLLSSTGVQNLFENAVTILNSKGEMIHSWHFANEANLIRQKYLRLKLPKKVHIGKGEKITVCLFSPMADKANYLSVPRNPSGEIGSLYVKPVAGDNIMDTLKSSSRTFMLEGSLCLRTYESNYAYLNWFKIFLLFLAALTALFLFYIEKVKLLVARLKFVPENIYVTFALIFGLVLVFLTPPLQTPDEQDHLNRAYQLSELNIFQYQSTVPSSLIDLLNAFGGMNFNSYKKTSVTEIIDQTKVALNPHVRTEIPARHFIFPYIPQAVGMAIGRAFARSPVELLYFGRVFNLLFSIVLIYLAIRLTPVLKWVLLLLGLMPMTIYLCASLSKDAMVIGLVFLLIAWFLRLAFAEADKIRKIDWLVLFVLSILVATGRSIYAILTGMFLMIPAARVGSARKYTAIFVGLLITVLLAIQIDFLRPLFRPQNNKIETSMLSSSSTPVPYDDLQRADRIKAPEGIDMPAQKRFILDNPVTYLGIMFETIRYYWRFYLDSFVGVLGWLNKPLPGWFINFYLVMLIISALLFHGKGLEISVKDKIIAASIFIIGVVLIETGLYLTWTPVGQEYIEGVQGRYFIPYAPLPFLLLYNPYFTKILSRQGPEPAKKRKLRQIKSTKAIHSDQPYIFYNYLYLLFICFVTLSLLITVYTVLTGYYIITM